MNERYHGGTANRKMYWISCSACGISQQHDNTSGYKYQSKAIDRWNRRKHTDKIVEQLEENYSCDVGNLKMISLDKSIEIVKGGAE